MADPRFPVGWAWTHYEGRGHQMRALFGENTCETKELGPVGGGGRTPEIFECRPANGNVMDAPPH